MFSDFFLSFLVSFHFLIFFFIFSSCCLVSAKRWWWFSQTTLFKLALFGDFFQWETKKKMCIKSTNVVGHYLGIFIFIFSFVFAFVFNKNFNFKTKLTRKTTMSPTQSKTWNLKFSVKFEMLKFNHCSEKLFTSLHFVSIRHLTLLKWIHFTIFVAELIAIPRRRT